MGNIIWLPELKKSTSDSISRRDDQYQKAVIIRTCKTHQKSGLIGMARMLNLQRFFLQKSSFF
jgi:hypothetical protein